VQTNTQGKDARASRVLYLFVSILSSLRVGKKETATLLLVGLQAPICSTQDRRSVARNFSLPNLLGVVPVQKGEDLLRQCLLNQSLTPA
jgi:hypothetical protein